MVPMLLFGLCIAFFASRVLKYWKGLRSVNYYPGFRVPFAPFSPLGSLFPTTWWNPGLTWSWKWRHTSYFNNTHDIISMVPFLMGEACFYTSSLDVTKQVLQHEGKHLTKPPDLSVGVLLWGENIFTANDNMWKRHRRIVGPAFSSKTYSLVWKECVALYKEMVVEEGWEERDSVFVSKIGLLPAKFAFTIIARCGFGLSIPWAENATASNEPSFGESMEYVLKTIIHRLAIPSWAYNLPIKRLRHMNHIWKSLSRAMHEMIASKKEELSSSTEGVEKQDVFSRLVSAHEGDTKYGLDEQEVIGNTFILMFAGQDTTSNALSATLALLAIHKDVQEQAYQEIQRVIPNNREPEYDDAPQLTYLLACFWEALRIYPAAIIIFREFTEDVSIKIERPQREIMVFRRGSRIMVDLIALSHDANIFPEPDKFKPSRWNDRSDHNLSMFGLGPRACVGRKFAQVEAVCFLCMILREWKLDVILREGETRQEYEERVMSKGRFSGLAFGVGPVSLQLTRRM